jgi:outer membrane protein OmpA-like peptidoglycan-associated protein
MKNKLLLILFLAGIVAYGQELPPNPEPGKCYVKCITKDEFKEVTESLETAPSYKKLKIIPATYKNVEERVMSKEAGKRIKIIPATYKMVEEKKLLKEASKKFVPVAATYKTAEERIMTKEASKKYVFIPATYKNTEEKLMVKDAIKKLTIVEEKFETRNVSYVSKEKSTALEIVPASFTKETKTFVKKEKSGKWEYTVMADCPSVNKEDCMTACFIETPEVTESIELTKLKNDASSKVLDCSNSNNKNLCEVQSNYKQTVLVNPATTNEVTIPAEYSSFKYQVIATPARYEEVVIPAEYTVVKKQVIDTPARVEEIEIPAEYTVVKKQVINTPERTEEEVIPAQYITIKRLVVDKPAQTVEEVVPAVTKTITKTQLVKKGGITSWEEVDCKLVGGANILPILYDLGSARLTPGSIKIIDDNLLKLMRDKPGLRIQIMSHTDSRGNDDYNMALSQQRAQSVVNHLVNKGISRNRLVAKGFGETQLKNKCSNGVECTDAQHQDNRRTEFSIIN